MKSKIVEIGIKPEDKLALWSFGMILITKFLNPFGTLYAVLYIVLPLVYLTIYPFLKIYEFPFLKIYEWGEKE